MLRILIFILLTSLFTNCNNSQDKSIQANDSISSLPKSDTALQKNHLDSLCQFTNPDTSLANIRLRDPESTIAIIGNKDHWDKDEKYHYCSSICREALTLTQHPGDGKYTISIFKVEYSSKGDHGYRKLNIDTFKTEKGIKLGMSKSQIIERLGNCYAPQDSSKNYIELYYRIELPKDSKTKLLERQNMPIYYAIYKVRMDRLEMFEFGFEYP